MYRIKICAAFSVIPIFATLICALCNPTPRRQCLGPRHRSKRRTVNKTTYFDLDRFVCVLAQHAPQVLRVRVTVLVRVQIIVQSAPQRFQPEKLFQHVQNSRSLRTYTFTRRYIDICDTYYP